MNKQNKQEAKADAGKPMLTLVPRQILFDVAKVREYGTKKYGDPDNWRQVDIQRYRDAAFRHFMSYLDDPQGTDEEGEPKCKIRRKDFGFEWNDKRSCKNAKI